MLSTGRSSAFRRRRPPHRALMTANNDDTAPVPRAAAQEHGPLLQSRLPAPKVQFPPDDAGTADQTRPAAARAGRPRLKLTDVQARKLVQQLGAIEALHADSPRHHRGYVHDFLRAVYHATGQVHGAAFYRKLLAAYAPGRKPSTPTIESEKILLQRELAQLPSALDAGAGAGMPAPAPPGAVQPAPHPATELALLQILSLQQELVGKLAQAQAAPNASGAASGLQAHNDYLNDRVAALEGELAAARSQAARLAGAAQEANALADERGAQLAALQETVVGHAAAMHKLTTELNGQRQFSMQAIDGVRGETRAVKERVVYLEALLKEKEEQVEMYRRMAMNKGADPLKGGLR